MTSPQHSRGFSFLEMALSLALLGVLAIAVVAYLAAINGSQRRTEQERLMRRAEQSLVAFVQANHHLPCPASDGDGAADCSAGQMGFVPWQELGLADARAGDLRYGVYRSGPDLTTAADRLEVIRLNDNDEPVRTRLNDGTANLLDTCRALGALSQRSRPTASDGLQLVADSRTRNVAYALAAPGAGDADGGGRFDGRQDDGDAELDWPGLGAHDNDDRVAAAGFSALAGRVACGEALASLGHGRFNTAVSAELMQRALRDYLAVAEAQVQVAEGQLRTAEANMALVGGITAQAAGGMSESFGRGIDLGESSAQRLAIAGVGVIASAFGPAGAALDEADNYLEQAERQRDAIERLLDNRAEPLNEIVTDRAEQAESQGF